MLPPPHHHHHIPQTHIPTSNDTNQGVHETTPRYVTPTSRIAQTRHKALEGVLVRPVICLGFRSGLFVLEEVSPSVRWSVRRGVRRPVRRWHCVGIAVASVRFWALGGGQSVRSPGEEMAFSWKDVEADKGKDK